MAKAPRIILLAPLGNLAVRDELARLIGGLGEIEDVSFEVSDAGSYQTDLLQRIESYLDSMQVLLKTRVTEPPFALVLGHTGCSYVASSRGPGWLEEVLSSTGAHRVITAAGAMEDRLRQEGIQRFELVSPYPLSAHNLAVEYWKKRGFDIPLDASMAGYNGTGSIYEISEDDVASFITSRTERLELDEPLDAIVFSGTGAPSLGVLEALESSLGIRVLSVNFALGNVVVDTLAGSAGD